MLSYMVFGMLAVVGINVAVKAEGREGAASPPPYPSKYPYNQTQNLANTPYSRNLNIKEINPDTLKSSANDVFLTYCHG